jgi:hypothetical protein
VYHPRPVPFKDRSAGLIVFGSLELLMGGCCGLMSPLMFANVFLLRALPEGQAPPTSTGLLIGAGLVYAGLGAFLITMGIGSIRARRWARTLTLITSWMWLICGVLGFGMMVTILPDLEAQIRAGAGTSSSVPTVVMWVLGAFLVVIYVLLPLAFVLFYRSPHVKATCEERDPSVPWTDRCPAPLLAISLLCAAYALFMVLNPLAYPVFFFVMLQGLPAVAVGFGLGAAFGFAAVELYRQRWRGWWVGFGAASLFGVANAIGFWNIDAVAFYQAMGYGQAMAEQAAPMLASMRWFMAAWVPIWIGSFLWVRRYLPARPAPA